MALDNPSIVRVLMAEREKLFSYIWAMVGDVHRAEDIFQDVSLFALEKGGEVESETHLRGWLRRTARFKAFESLRQAKRTPMALDEAVLEKLEDHWVRYDLMSDADQSDMLAMLKECMRRLTSNGRRLLLLRYAKGLRSREIAAQLKRKVETVYQAIARAHRDLHDCIRNKIAARNLPHE